MKKTVAKAWIRALRSERFTQCRQVLSAGEGEFCVLGVLCELYRARTAGVEWKETTWNAIAYAPKEYRKPCRAFKVPGDDKDLTDDKHMPPLAVWEWAGLFEHDIHLLSAKNDQGTDFLELSYMIEDMAGLT